jgi:hypothetical protein
MGLPQCCPSRLLSAVREPSGTGVERRPRRLQQTVRWIRWRLAAEVMGGSSIQDAPCPGVAAASAASNAGSGGTRAAQASKRSLPPCVPSVFLAAPRPGLAIVPAHPLQNQLQVALAQLAIGCPLQTGDPEARPIGAGGRDGVEDAGSHDPAVRWTGLTLPPRRPGRPGESGGDHRPFDNRGLRNGGRSTGSPWPAFPMARMGPGRQSRIQVVAWR